MTDFSYPSRNPLSVFSDLRVNHVCYRVPDYAAGRGWLTEKFDFRVVIEWPFGGMQLGYFAAPNDDGTIIELIGDGETKLDEKPPVTDLGASFGVAGPHHFCFYVRSVDASVAELRRRGVVIVAEPFILDDISRRLAFFADPFGNLFELAEII